MLSVKEEKCMVCGIEWDDEFLSKYLTKSFINKELKIHRENNLMEKQMGLMPETQVYAEQVKVCDELLKENRMLLLEKNKMMGEILKMNKKMSETDRIIERIRSSEYVGIKVGTFTYKCPINNCQGFLNERYKCGICENAICKDCMEIREEGHECEKEKKETVALINKDTKPCPKCGEMINKIVGGCDQMYCIRCHSAFSWRTGALDGGTIHNPEYYRWMRENGKEIARNPLDEVGGCGENIISYMTLIRIMRMYFVPEWINLLNGGVKTKDHIETIKVLNMHRMINHIAHLNREYVNDNNREERTLREMRVSYMLNKITKEELKRKLQIIEKRKKKEKRLNNVWNLLKIVLTEYIGKISEERENKYIVKIVKEITEESDKIREYSNMSFMKVGEMYNMVYPGITVEWIQVPNWLNYVRQRQGV